MNRSIQGLVALMLAASSAGLLADESSEAQMSAPSCDRVGCVEPNWSSKFPVGATLAFRICENRVEKHYAYVLAENGWRLNKLHQQTSECTDEAK